MFVSEAWSEAVKIMKAEYCVSAITKFQMDHGIIFCRTKLDCDNLERHLRSLQDFRRFSCVCLHGDRKPHERKANLEKFKNKEVKFLICTDVAARGLDIKAGFIFGRLARNPRFDNVTRRPRYSRGQSGF